MTASDVATGSIGFDRELQQQLAGVRLVGELDLDGEVFETAARFASEVPRDPRAIRRFAEEHPALYVFYLVAVGAHEGDGGELWSFVPFAADDQRLQRAAGEAFEAALRKLGLETFWQAVEQEHGMRFVMPVLLHSMVPRKSYRRLLEGLLRELRKGAVGAAEVIQGWRESGDLDHMTRPVQRFFRYGGGLSTDFLDRHIAYVAAVAGGEVVEPSDYGLPGFVAEEFAALGDVASTIKRLRAPRPTLEFDPWTRDGPVLIFPSTEQVKEWVIRAEGNLRRIRGSSMRETPVELPIARRWEVEGRRQHETVSRIVFEASSHGVLLFDPDSHQLLRSSITELSSVYALTGPGVALRTSDGQPVRPVEELPELVGDWGAFTALHVSLDGTDGLRALRGDDEASIFDAAPAPRRAQLIGEPLPGVTTDDGLAVYDALPNIKLPDDSHPRNWQIQVKYGGSRVKERVDRLPTVATVAGELHTLQSVLKVPLAGVVEISVRGPLGSDVEDRFGVVSDLVFPRPIEMVAPEQPVNLRLAAHAGVMLDGDPRETAVAFSAGVDRKIVDARAPSSSIALQLSIPRLVWSLSDRTRPEKFGCVVPTVDAREHVRLDQSLWIRTGVPLEVSLALVSPNGVMQETERVTTGRRLGAWRFDLGRFRDTVAASREPEIWYELRADNGLCQRVATLRRGYELRGFEVEVEVDDATGRRELTLVFDEQAPMTSRVLRLWSTSAPLDPPTEFAIPDEVRSGELLVFDLAGLGAGTFIAELTLQGEAKLYPGGDRKNVAPVEVPSEDGRDPAELDPAVGVPEPAEVEAASDDEAIVLVRRALGGLVASMDPPAELDPDWNLAERAVETLLVRPGLFYRSFARLEDERLVRSHHLRVRLALSLLPGAVDCPPEAGDLPILDLVDLWELSPLLGAIADVPGRAEAAVDRWSRRTGWSPGSTPPTPGKKFAGPILMADAAKLNEWRAKLQHREHRALRMSGFELGIVDWLSRSRGDHTRVEGWMRRYGTVIRGDQSCFPDSAPRAIAALRTDKGPSALRFPHDLFVCGLQLVCFSGREFRAKEALVEAAELAPRLVERQVLLALAHKLMGDGVIDLTASEDRE